MPRKKDDVQIVPEVQETEPKVNKLFASDLKSDMIEVGCKLCSDLMAGKARDEKTALTAIVEIYNAVSKN